MKIVVNSKRGTQVRTRTTGWTKAKRQIFLDHLAATCNVTGAATAAGMSDRGAHMLRQRDPGFAELWREAMELGYEEIEIQLLYCAVGDNPDDIDSTRADTSRARFDPDLALRVLKYRDGLNAGVRPRDGERLVTKHVSMDAGPNRTGRRKAINDGRAGGG